jgi:hypothetical protein
MRFLSNQYVYSNLFLGAVKTNRQLFQLVENGRLSIYNGFLLSNSSFAIYFCDCGINDIKMLETVNPVFITVSGNPIWCQTR